MGGGSPNSTVIGEGFMAEWIASTQHRCNCKALETVLIPDQGVPFNKSNFRANPNPL
jgi:hypothetical protein